MTITTAPATALACLREQVSILADLMDEHDERDDGSFPLDAWELLTRTGLTSATTSPVSTPEELALVRGVASIDVSLGRILDGHLNGVSRLARQVDDEALVMRELDGVRDGSLRLGVWGADPAPGEGEPAYLAGDSGGCTLHGTKTFCSGAGGLHRAFVPARGPGDEAPVSLAYIDLEQGVVVDRSWFGGAGMRGSASHRVTFTGARVLWLAPDPGALLLQPWFAGDAIRTAASWAGGADIAVAQLVETLRARGADGDLESLAVARAQTAQRAIGLWLEAAGVAVDDPELAEVDLEAIAVQARAAIADDIRVVLDEAARAVGSRPFAAGGRLERARRDLETYLLQHRLEPLLVKAGRNALAL